MKVLYSVIGERADFVKLYRESTRPLWLDHEPSDSEVAGYLEETKSNTALVNKIYMDEKTFSMYMPDGIHAVYA